MREELINILGSVNLVGTELVGTVGCEGVDQVNDLLSTLLTLFGSLGLREKSRLSCDDLLSDSHVKVLVLPLAEPLQDINNFVC